MGLNSKSSIHIPVLAEQVVQHLVSDLGGAYIDLTAGYGGHLTVLSKILNSRARLYGFDIDSEAAVIAERNLASCKQKVRIINDSYVNIGQRIEELQDREFDGMLLDLGLSSLQLNDPKRGFTFQADGPLDMRFGSESSKRTAADFINEEDEKEIAGVFFRFGEEKRAKALAATIVRERQKKMILTSGQLADIVMSVIKPPHQTKSLARVFQSLRIAVNDELNQISLVLPQAVKLLKQGGKLAVISYHSLEDRIVKRFFQYEAKDCHCPPEIPICVCNHKAAIKIVNKKIIIPNENEIRENSRARSAKMRVAEKV